MTKPASTMPCSGCDRPMRGYGVSVKQAQGTVARASGDRCVTCNRGDKKRGASCLRCPQPPSVRGVICRDCRDVMSKEEKALWAA